MTYRAALPRPHYAGFFDTVGKALSLTNPATAFVAFRVDDRIRHALSMPSAKKQAQLSILIPCYRDTLAQMRRVESSKPKDWRKQRALLEGRLKAYEKNPSLCPSYVPPPDTSMGPGGATSPTLPGMETTSMSYPGGSSGYGPPMPSPQAQAELAALQQQQLQAEGSSPVPLIVGGIVVLSLIGAGAYAYSRRKKAKD